MKLPFFKGPTSQIIPNLSVSHGFARARGVGHRAACGAADGRRRVGVRDSGDS